MSMATRIPPIGTRYGFKVGRTERLVYELIESLPTGTGAPDLQRRGGGERAAAERHTLRCVVCEGFVGESVRKVGSVIHVEDAWFKRPDIRELVEESKGAA